MNTACKDCIWYDQCGLESREKCEDFSPADETETNEAFYGNILRENAEEYEEMIRDYSDKE